MDIGYGIWDIGYIDMGLDIKRVPVFEHTHTHTHHHAQVGTLLVYEIISGD